MNCQCSDRRHAASPSSSDGVVADGSCMPTSATTARHLSPNRMHGAIGDSGRQGMPSLPSAAERLVVGQRRFPQDVGQGFPDPRTQPDRLAVAELHGLGGSSIDVEGRRPSSLVSENLGGLDTTQCIGPDVGVVIRQGQQVAGRPALHQGKWVQDHLSGFTDPGALMANLELPAPRQAFLNSLQHPVGNPSAASTPAPGWLARYDETSRAASAADRPAASRQRRRI